MRCWPVLLTVAVACGGSGGSGATTATSASTTTGSGGSTGTASAGTTTGVDTDTGRSTGDTTGSVTPWYAGTFRYLPAIAGDLPTFADDLPHPEAGDYVPLDPSRSQAFDAFLDEVDATLAQVLLDGDTGDFCALSFTAAAAGYAIFRFHDTTRERWYLYARDDTTDGQAYLFIDPDPRRDLIVEAPHDPADSNTSLEGARVFTDLNARALILNGDHRCSSPTPTTCSGTTTQCGGQYRISDVAHHLDNTFHRAHVWYSDNLPTAKFPQLHGFVGSVDEVADVSDGTTNDDDPGSIANTFATFLGARGPDPGVIYSCQAPGDPPIGLCGSTNVQGRHTNDPGNMACTQSTTMNSNRFLHIEQRLTLRDDDESDGWSWKDVSTALAMTWPDCVDGNCTPPPPRPGPDALPDCTCGQPCP